MENRAHALAAGIFVIVMAIAVAAAGWWFSGRTEQTKDYLVVSQRPVSGLNPQAQVRYRGIRVGKVEDVDWDRNNPRNVLIRIRIDDDIPVTRGTSARLHSQGVTGLAYVMLDDDGSNAQPLPAGEGGLPRIALAPSMMDTLGEVAERLTKAFDDKALADMRRTLANTATASEGLKEMPQIMASLREALSDANRKRLSNILAHLETTLGQAAPLTKEMRGLVASMQGVSERLDRITDEGGTGSVARLNDLLDNLQRNSRQFDRVLQGLEEAPQSVVFGRQSPSPGPGETGYGSAAK